MEIFDLFSHLVFRAFFLLCRNSTSLPSVGYLKRLNLTAVSCLEYCVVQQSVCALSVC